MIVFLSESYCKNILSDISGSIKATSYPSSLLKVEAQISLSNTYLVAEGLDLNKISSKTLKLKYLSLVSPYCRYKSLSTLLNIRSVSFSDKFCNANLNANWIGTVLVVCALLNVEFQVKKAPSTISGSLSRSIKGNWFPSVPHLNLSSDSSKIIK